MTALDTNALVAVIGAGAMGAGIAQVAAQAGHPVKLYDNRPGASAQAIAGIDQQLGRLVEKASCRQMPGRRSSPACNLSMRSRPWPMPAW